MGVDKGGSLGEGLEADFGGALCGYGSRPGTDGRTEKVAGIVRKMP